MIDVKIVGVTLVVLMILGFGISGYAESTETNSENEGFSLSLFDLVERFLGSFETEDEDRFEANLFVDFSDEVSEVELREANISSQELNDFQIGEAPIRIEENVELQGFDGALRAQNRSARIEGSVRVAENEEFITTNVTEFKAEELRNEIQAEVGERSDFDMEGVTPTIESADGRSELDENQTLSVDGFVGSLTMWPEREELELDGNFSRIEAGSYIIED